MLTVFAKCSILHVWQGSEHSFAGGQVFPINKSYCIWRGFIFFHLLQYEFITIPNGFATSDIHSMLHISNIDS